MLSRPLFALAQANEAGFLVNLPDESELKTGQLILPKWGQFHKPIMDAGNGCNTIIFNGLLGESRVRFSRKMDGIGGPQDRRLVTQFAK